MKKYDLNDTIFIIPLRIDSIDRLENLQFTTRYLLRYFTTNIIIWEADVRSRLDFMKPLPKGILHIFQEDYDTIFYRTKFINKAVLSIDKPFVAIWDADVIAPKEQIISAVEYLRSKKADFIYPFTDRMLNVPSCVKNIYAKQPDISILECFKLAYSEMYGPKCVGGGFFANREKYIEAGMENENFYGWGIEDGERIRRWMRLEYKVERIEGVLFHFDHSRGINSTIHNADQSSVKIRELHRINIIPKDTLKQEVQSWRKSHEQE